MSVVNTYQRYQNFLCDPNNLSNYFCLVNQEFLYNISYK